MSQAFRPYTLQLRSQKLSIDKPLIMGIVNATPDSFYACSRTFNEDALQARVERLVSEGVDVIDVGACSTRPGTESVSPDEECKRLERAMAVVKRVAPQMVVSVDTFRADVAKVAVMQLGADIVNDVSGGTLDTDMFATVADLKVPYVLMHMRGTPATMQQHCDYPDGVLKSVIADLRQKLLQLRGFGVNDVIVDPGFGFAKTLEQNYQLLAHLSEFHVLDAPLLVGLSRKSMIGKALGVAPEEALNGTTVLNTIALLAGAHFLRVHDVKAAVEARKLVSLTINNE